MARIYVEYCRHPSEYPLGHMGPDREPNIIALLLDSGLRRNDGCSGFLTYLRAIPLWPECINGIEITPDAITVDVLLQVNTTRLHPHCQKQALE
ncbi:MAG: hypothetical protein COB30_018255 [Ectothiorhodospiraceae bacterium]|nr:hypothetical protein [Ectothiorhodospiraceae bacterium]